jgi:NitT/TauT family transport system ATP-binding protein/nitrate/nitrite transport system substrate-binding protein
MRAIDLGFIALTDAAPLIVAAERGFFEAEDLRVTLRREVSWATLRDKVAAGFYEGAHMLAPAVLAANLDAGGRPAPLIAPLSLNAHGATIGVSDRLAAEMQAHAPEAGARALASVVAERRTQGRPAVSFAVVFAYSIHNYMLRAWVASAGLDPDNDIRIVTAPPTAIAGRLRAEEIDGFGVGAPWGALCENESGARIVLDASAFWPGGPDKLLGLSAPWASREPEAALALTRAVLRAAIWADAPENAGALALLLSGAAYVGAPAELIARRLNPHAPDRIRFASAAHPRPAHARWIVSQMVRWRQAAPDSDFQPALDAYRPDMFHRAAEAVGLVEAAAPESGPLLGIA